MSGSTESGFTLIEILIALVIVSVGILALGNFGVASMSSGQTSRERLTAVHLAEQIIEAWQSSDTLPTLDTSYCQSASAWSTSTASSAAPCPTTDTVTTSTASCAPLSGAKISYTITTKESRVCGPPAAGGASHAFFSASSEMDNDTTVVTTLNGGTNPRTKVVTVSWSRRGADHSVYLTHLSRVE